MNEIFQTVTQIIIGTLSIIGLLVCANYIFENYICGKREILNLSDSGEAKNKYMKKNDSVCLVLNADEIGDKLEYYIRIIQNGIANGKYIYISKIVLYSERYSEEVVKICELLAYDYANIEFVKGGYGFLFSDSRGNK